MRLIRRILVSQGHLAEDSIADRPWPTRIRRGPSLLLQPAADSRPTNSRTAWVDVKIRYPSAASPSSSKSSSFNCSTTFSPKPSWRPCGQAASAIERIFPVSGWAISTSRSGSAYPCSSSQATRRSTSWLRASSSMVSSTGAVGLAGPPAPRRVRDRARRREAASRGPRGGKRRSHVWPGVGGPTSASLPATGAAPVRRGTPRRRGVGAPPSRSVSGSGRVGRVRCSVPRRSWRSWRW